MESCCLDCCFFDRLYYVVVGFSDLSYCSVAAGACSLYLQMDRVNGLITRRIGTWQMLAACVLGKVQDIPLSSLMAALLAPLSMEQCWQCHASTVNRLVSSKHSRLYVYPYAYIGPQLIWWLMFLCTCTKLHFVDCRLVNFYALHVMQPAGIPCTSCTEPSCQALKQDFWLTPVTFFTSHIMHWLDSRTVPSRSGTTWHLQTRQVCGITH